MATIRIADAGGPPRPDGSGIGGGVYPIRATSIERTRTRSRSRDARSRHSDLKDAEEDAELRQDGDFKKRQVRLIRTIIMACMLV
jgi:KUP system potassium uptake protein